MIDANLVTPKLAAYRGAVERLQGSLHAKAKAEPSYRFYSLWDKVYREDVLYRALRHCQRNGGSHGVDKETFEDIKSLGEEQWLGQLREELQGGRYKPQPLRRVWIDKANGKKQRPLSIACVKDRVVQSAMLLVLNPIFEADFLPEQYGFRPAVDAKMAIRRVYFHITQHKRTEIVDADLKDYFSTIPHGALMKCLSRRIADGQILQLIKQWLEVPIIEQTGKHTVQTQEAKAKHRGIAQGSPLSPLQSNCYFRRFLLAWKCFGIEDTLEAGVVNYGDDFVICCKPQTANKAMEYMRKIISGIDLTINEAKTKVVKLPEERFDFLGYAIGQFYNKLNQPYWGTQPSKKAIKKVISKIHDETSIQTTWKSSQVLIHELNQILRGWCGYFNQGPVLKSYRVVSRYAERRVRRWLVKKHKVKGTKGYRQFPEEYLYKKLGLYQLASKMADVPKAKA